MRIQIVFFVLLIISVSCKRQKKDTEIVLAPQSSINWNYADSLINEIRYAEIPTDTFYLKELGLESGTSQIQNAVEKISNQGGGTLIIPKGEYLCTPIILKSKINLHLEEGAIIKFIPKPEDYPMAYTWFNGIPCMNYSPMIYAMNENDIQISGKGTIDGQGFESVWKNMKYHENIDWDLLKELEEEDVKPQNRKFGDGHSLRPALVSFIQCSRINITGVSIINSPYWVMYPILCNNVVIKNGLINSRGYDQIGIAIESSKNVLIDSMKIQSVSEGVKIFSGRVDIQNNQASSNILIQNSTIENIASSALIISSKIIAGANRIFMSNLTINDSKAAIRIYGEQMGDLNDVFFKNIHANNITYTFFYGRIIRSKKPEPTVYNIHFDNIKTENCSRAFYIQGHTKNSFQNINISNSEFSTSNGSFIKNIQNLSLSNVQENNNNYNGKYSIAKLEIPRINFEGSEDEVLDSDDIQYNKLPEKVKQTLNTNYPQVPINDIDRMITSSNVIYDIELD
jgi:polygalacturonase